ncbi:STAS domain-containing protein [Lentzea sp. NPDC060358]|uniref:STAS domain-containing protein n=1 Tax=Lentzea sp. NPDC060358 TaxID=3347103 RepID=UPI0036686AAB
MSQQSNGAVQVLTAHTSDHDGITLVTVVGEVDRMTPDSPLLQALDAVRGLPAGVVVDLNAVTFFGSAGVNMLAAVWQQAEASAVPLAIVAGARTVLMPLAISGVDALLALFPSQAEAFTALKAVPPPRRR